MTGTSIHFSSARTGEKEQDTWETPSWLFNALNNKFNFSLDATASVDNHLCDEFFTAEDDAIRQSWKGLSTYCNPPYSQLKAFAKKAYEEASEGALVVMLIPARTDTVAFHEYLSKGHVYFLKGRLKFTLAGVEKDCAPFPSMIVVMSPEAFDKPHMETITKEDLIDGF